MTIPKLAEGSVAPQHVMPLSAKSLANTITVVHTCELHAGFPRDMQGIVLVAYVPLILGMQIEQQERDAISGFCISGGRKLMNVSINYPMLEAGKIRCHAVIMTMPIDSKDHSEEELLKVCDGMRAQFSETVARFVERFQDRIDIGMLRAHSERMDRSHLEQALTAALEDARAVESRKLIREVRRPGRGIRQKKSTAARTWKIAINPNRPDWRALLKQAGKPAQLSKPPSPSVEASTPYIRTDAEASLELAGPYGHSRLGYESEERKTDVKRQPAFKWQELEPLLVMIPNGAEGWSWSAQIPLKVQVSSKHPGWDGRTPFSKEETSAMKELVEGNNLSYTLAEQTDLDSDGVVRFILRSNVHAQQDDPRLATARYELLRSMEKLMNGPLARHISSDELKRDAGDGGRGAAPDPAIRTAKY